MTASIDEDHSSPIVHRSSFIVSPNPAQSFFILSYPASLTKVSGLELIDAAGKRVRSFRSPPSSLRISLDGVQPGVYFCRLNTASGMLAERLLVVR